MVSLKKTYPEIPKFRMTHLYEDASKYCTMAWTTFSHLSEGTALYSPNDNVRDLHPSAIPLHFYEGKINLTKTLRAGHCVGRTLTGLWFVERVGPFVSQGSNFSGTHQIPPGVNWFDVSWSNVGGLRSMIQARDYLDLTGSLLMIVDDNGLPLSSPPIHQHHIFLGPATRNRVPGPLMSPVHYGDTQECPLASGGAEVQGEDFEDTGFTKRLTEPLRIMAAINDVRIPGTAPLSWWIHVSFRASLRNDSSIRPLSVLHVGQPYGSPINHFPLYIPSSKESFFYYTGIMHYKGTLVNLFAHSHAALLQTALLLEGSPIEFTLGIPPFKAASGCEPIFTSTTKQGNNDLLSAYFVSLASSRLICNFSHNSIDIRGQSFDRCVSVSCREWLFKPNSKFTAIVFNGPKPYERFSVLPHVEFLQHWDMFFLFDSGDSISHFDAEMAYMGDGLQQLSKALLLFRWLANDGCSPESLTPSGREFLSYAVMVVVMLLVCMCQVWVCRRVYFHCLKGSLLM